MAGFTSSGTYTGAVLIKEAYEPGFIDAVYTNNDLLKLFPAPTAHQGGRYIDWIVRKAGNTSVEVFTEGANQPAAGNQSWVLAYVSPTYFRAMVQISGHARDAMKSAYLDGLDAEMVLAQEDIRDLMNTSFMGGTYGLELAVDAGSTYAGIARGSAAYWESTETAHSAALSYTGLIDLYETIRNNDKGGQPGLIVGPHNQLTNFYNLGGQPGLKVIDPTDPAKGYSSQSFNGVPFVGIGDMTDTVIAMLDMRPGQWATKIVRPFEVKTMAPSGDSDIYQISTAAALVCFNPAKHGKLTGVTA